MVREISWTQNFLIMSRAKQGRHGNAIYSYVAETILPFYLEALEYALSRSLSPALMEDSISIL